MCEGHAEEREEIRRHPRATDALRFGLAREVAFPRPQRCHLGEVRLGVAPRLVEHDRCRKSRDLFPAFWNDDFRAVDALRLVVRKRLEQHRVGDAENCRSRTDAKSEGRNRRCRKSGIPGERSAGVSKVVRRGAERRDAVHGVNVFAHASGVADLPPRREPGLVRIHPRADVPGGQQLEMRFQLLGHLIDQTSTSRQEAQARQKPEEPRENVHGCGTVRRRRAITAAMRCQFLASAVNWRRPARVMA